MDSFTSQIHYRNKRIGDLDVSKTSGGVKACFSMLDIQSTLEDIGASYFNWIQTCTKDSHPPFDIHNQQIKTPYLDPYPGGYALQSQPDFYYWNDGLQYYWDMRNIRTDGRGCYDVSCTLKNNLTDTSLLFQDKPNVGEASLRSGIPFAPTSVGEVEFKTYLVAVDADFRLIHVFVDFSWGVKKTSEGTKVTLDRCGDNPRDYIDLY